MMKFRKKPIVVEANQYLHPGTAPLGVSVTEDGRAYVTTIHNQRSYLVLGDWVIQEPDGVHYYPCKPDIFARTYEAV